jgi:tetratricopeptide (TPR) repeat protein
MELPPDYCFPNHLEAVLALQAAIQLNPADSRAPYYLGNFWYAHRRYSEAIKCWEQSRQLDDQFPTVHRNLGLAYFNKLDDPQWALCSLEEAFHLDQQDGRVFFELDQLYKRMNQTPDERLARLEAHQDLVEQRDDLMTEYITLLNIQERYAEALELLTNHEFHPWEGGEGKVPAQYVWGLVGQAREWIESGHFSRALENLERACCYPDNLGEGKLYGTQENHVHYFSGCVYEALGDSKQAEAYFQKAATGLSEPNSAMFYNDQPPDMIYYQGLARQKLGQSDQAAQIFQRLVDFGRQHVNDAVQMDYFAVSLPDFLVFDDDLTQRNRTHCHYMMALGYLGLSDQNQAESHFDQVLAMDSNHFGAYVHKRYLESG